MSQYFPKPCKPFGGNINFKVDLPNYATKTDFKKATGVGTSNLALKSNLVKPEVDQIDVEKLKTVPVDLSKVNNLVNNEFVEKTVYAKLVAKVNNIDISEFVLKTKYDTDKSDLGKKNSDADKQIPNISGLVKETDYNAKITEIENKTPSINGLATTSTLTAIENKIPDISILIKKPDYDAKILDIESKHITTADYNKFAKNLVASNIESEELVDKSVIGGFINSADLDKKKAATLATKAEPKAEQDKIIKLQAFDSNYFRGKNHFEDDGNQKYLVFQPMYRYFANV